MWTYKKVVEKYCTGEEKIIGLGSGNTATHLMGYLKDVLSPHTAMVGTSTQSELLISSYGLLPVLMEGVRHIDLYLDGADYVDDNGLIIKGYGGALTLERIAMSTADQIVIVIQKHKRVRSMEGLFVPVEVMKPALSSTLHYLESCGIQHSLRTGIRASLYTTDSGNAVIDVQYSLSVLETLLQRPGVVAHGLVLPKKNLTVVEVEE
ncbi:ribose 5-phosphate isomerase A [Nematocida sp. AWRm77]|nr:ribose 5-phosphate isomerase A [Nematocida sp. AWRm77]